MYFYRHREVAYDKSKEHEAHQRAVVKAQGHRAVWAQEAWSSGEHLPYSVDALANRIPKRKANLGPFRQRFHLTGRLVELGPVSPVTGEFASPFCFYPQLKVGDLCDSPLRIAIP